MKILILSAIGSAHDLAVLMASKGSEIRYFQQQGDLIDRREILISYSDTWRDQLEWPDMVICDSPYFSYRFRNITRNGTPLLYFTKHLERVQRQQNGDTGSRSIELGNL